MSRHVYLTARCTRGCELWGTPEVIARHVDERRCRGLAWFRKQPDTVLIGARYARLLEGSIAAHLLRHFNDTAVRPSAYRPYEVRNGAGVRSPIDGIEPRVWWLCVKAYLDADIAADEVLALALDAASFDNLMPDDHLASFQRCNECGELVVEIHKHQTMSSRCRIAAGANRVNELWARGYRDPWTATDHPPTTWTELRTARWKPRVAVVELPHANAVLIAPARSSSQHQQETP